MFEQVVGQENPKRVLSAMVESGNIPHALLFAGPDGTGKGEAAFELARLLLCQHGPNSGCNTCGACVRASRLEHPDLHLLFPFRNKPESNEGEWFDELQRHRELLAGGPYPTVMYEKGRVIVKYLMSEVQERLMESSLEGGRRVCVIIGADRLNPTTGNRLLKILEEPPEGVHFILTAERLSTVLPTIVSRSSVIRFRRLRVPEIAAYLARYPELSPERREACARLGDGSIKAARAFAFEHKDDLRGQAFALYEKAALGGPDAAVSGAAPFLHSREIMEAEEIIAGFALYTRTVLESKFGIDPRNAARSEKLSSLARAANLPSLNRLSRRIEEGLDMLGRNVNISLIMTQLLYEIHDTYR